MIKDYFAQYCDRCVHSHLDPARGVVCGLTDDRPDRTRPCDDLVIDVEREENVQFRERLRGRVDAYLAIDDQGAALDPYPDPQGHEPTGWSRVRTYLLTVIMLLLVAGVLLLRFFLED
ncbi:MAG: hypothetical protein R3D98_02450 [Candidatus Krumholzibacteriia bacterium]